MWKAPEIEAFNHGCWKHDNLNTQSPVNHRVNLTSRILSSRKKKYWWTLLLLFVVHWSLHPVCQDDMAERGWGWGREWEGEIHPLTTNLSHFHYWTRTSLGWQLSVQSALNLEPSAQNKQTKKQLFKITMALKQQQREGEVGRGGAEGGERDLPRFIMDWAECGRRWCTWDTNVQSSVFLFYIYPPIRQL